MNNWFSSAILFILILTFSASSRIYSQTAAVQNHSSSAVDAFVAEQMRQWHIPGLSLVVVRHGKIIKTTDYGLANVELSVPATPNTVCEIGSVTKQFTATAVMMLVEENKIKLDDAIGT